jgi:glycosyl hydrolase family 26
MNRGATLKRRVPTYTRATCVALACLAAALAPQANAKVALGVTIENAPGSLAPLQAYTRLAGRAPDIVMWYQQWSEPLLYSSQAANMKAFGGVPEITWMPTLDGSGIPLSRIAAGSYDSTITAAARAAVNYKAPMYIRFAHEMNLAGSPYGPGRLGNTPALFVRAWRRVVNIFRNAGATNVKWIWSPNVDCAGKCPFTAFYPGDAYVDYVALDGYNYASVDKVKWMSFDQIFGASYAELTTLTAKPVMIGEMSSTELGGDKAKWIADAFQSIRSRYPRIAAVTWFDRVKESDWTINSSSRALAAWRAVVGSPVFGGKSAGTAARVRTNGSHHRGRARTPKHRHRRTRGHRRPSVHRAPRS